MKPMLTILLSLLVGCAGPKKVTVTDGSIVMTVEQTGHVGGKDFTHVTRSKAGALAITSRSDMEGSFRDGAQSVVAGVGLYQTALTSRANDAADAAVALGAQRAGVASEGIKAGVERARIGADVIKSTNIPR